jgi:hypothetical protein
MYHHKTRTVGTSKYLNSSHSAQGIDEAWFWHCAGVAHQILQGQGPTQGIRQE